MSKQEWESLCDGCAKCCLLKYEDEQTKKVSYTHIVCRYLDQKKCKCTKYTIRNKLVPSCIHLDATNIHTLNWLPKTCAYRLVSEGQDLPPWHPLHSKNPNSVHEAGQSVRGKVVSEDYVHPEGWEEHIIFWAD